MAGFFKKLLQRFTKPDIDWDDLEEQLIAGDLGAKLAMKIVADLQSKQRTLHGVDIIEVTKQHIKDILPAQVPLLLATVSATQNVLLGQPLAEVGHWLQLLAVADLVYVVVGLLTFEFILDA